MDAFDLLRKLRHKVPSDEEPAAGDYRRRMVAVAPVIGAKPSSGVLAGVAGNVAFYRGDPKTTHISSLVGSLTFSSKKQTAFSGRFTMFTRDDRWRVEGDNRLQWTSLDTYDLGTGTAAGSQVNAKYDFFRVYETAQYRLHSSLFAGVGLHFNDHTNVRPGNGVTEQAWTGSPYVQYSQEHGFAVDRQISAGASLNLLLDSRDNAINPDRGWLANGSFRTFFKDFLGGDSTWQELYLDVRTYTKVARGGRQKLAFWVYGDFVVGGVPPYLDLPATAMDTYGRSGRGYGEGRFRGERLLYGEIEYRATLMRSGLVGMVAFLNTTTVTNLETGERLFNTFATGGGLGLRLLINKHSKTNLCLDVGLGKQGSHGVYLAIQEAF
jgi:outer membrane protein assembly factor BamA